MIKEIYEVGGIDQSLPVDVRQFIVNMPTITGSITTIKELY